MKKPAAAITMVKDDHFFLTKWVKYYGDLFGRDALYIVNHGGSDAVRDIAAGCNVMSIPDEFDEKFDLKRWRFLTNMTNGLRNYYRYVICGDVDEFVVLDPKLGMDLSEFLEKRGGRKLITPLGLEVVHRREVETAKIGESILAVREYCRFSTYFCKPCVIGVPIGLSRGGHYSDNKNLLMFKNLYLFHMKYCDHDLYDQTLNARKIQTRAAAKKAPKSSVLSADWFDADDRGTKKLDELANLPIKPRFDFSDRMAEMDSTWSARGEQDLWHFKKHVGQKLYKIPERFAGIV